MWCGFIFQVCWVNVTILTFHSENCALNLQLFLEKISLIMHGAEQLINHRQVFSADNIAIGLVFFAKGS